MFYENTVYKIVFKAHNDFEVPLYFLLSFIAILAQEKIVAWYWNSGVCESAKTTVNHS